MKIIKDKIAKLSFVVLLTTCLAAMFYTPAASADRSIVMNNGMTCWVNDVGVIYGCAGGVRNKGDSGFNDVQTGRRYESTSGNQAVDTQTGRTFGYPGDDEGSSYANDEYLYE